MTEIFLQATLYCVKFSAEFRKFKESLCMGISTKSASVAILNRPSWIFQINLRRLLLSLITYNLRQNMPKSAVNFFFTELFMQESGLPLLYRRHIGDAILIFSKQHTAFGSSWCKLQFSPQNVFFCCSKF